jgi:hypothetical protein
MQDVRTSVAIVRLVRVRGDACSTPGAYHFCNSQENEAEVQAASLNILKRQMVSLKKVGHTVFTLLDLRNEGSFEEPCSCEKHCGDEWSGCWNARYEIDSMSCWRVVLARKCG